MTNLSLNGEDIILNRGKFIVIDALYLNDIKAKIDSLSTMDLGELRKTIFPYTDVPFAEIKIETTQRLKISQIQKVAYEKIADEDKSYCFSSDTGLIVFLKETLLKDFLIGYDYYQLVDSETEPVNRRYWLELTAKYEAGDTGLVLAPGIDSGYDFEGSGTYKIHLK
jgi:hypothetical protein